MVCPKCKVSTMIRRRGNMVVRICRNKRCKNYDKIVTVLEVAPPPPSEEEVEASEEVKVNSEEVM